MNTETATINIWGRVRREQKVDVLVNAVGNREKIEVKILKRKRDSKVNNSSNTCLILLLKQFSHLIFVLCLRYV